MSFDRATFYASLRHGTLFDHGLSQRQVEGIEAILNAWDKLGYRDLRWLAYALGTTYHETGRAMYPVREGGQGKGHPYGIPGADGQAAFGRGFVQITWASNYEKADKALGLGGKLIANYDLALEPDIAAQILLRGMAEAWFTHFRLSDYLNDHLAEVSARAADRQRDGSRGRCRELRSGFLHRDSGGGAQGGGSHRAGTGGQTGRRAAHARP